ncbi:MAG: RtcB family protein [Anaerolineae bacterium]|nr:RtcB family protein [Anaerolineae bacterium]
MTDTPGGSRAPHTYFGAVESFEAETFRQIETVERLPVTERTALLPDAHPGYGMPIGGVAALHNAIAPGFVGYDIACRMMVSVLDISPDDFLREREHIAQVMRATSNFGLNSHYPRGNQKQHPVLADPRWQETPLLRGLHSLAREQLGTSGAGNHFFDALVGEDQRSGMPVAAVMTHSGSRGVGYKVASHYIRLAAAETRQHTPGIPNGYEWLRLDRDSGREYLRAMQLMGDFAQANHELIHDAFLARSGLRLVQRFENHHNYAWVEGESVIHRKGATPAHAGQVGIIPGSSGTASYVTLGKGNPDSLASSSHGAGRTSSRTAARKQFDADAFQRHMRQHDILPIGVAADETWEAYKDIDAVIDAQVQAGILEVWMRLEPKIVVMGGEKGAY